MNTQEETLSEAAKPKRGRPVRINVPRERIEQLRHDRWNWDEIAGMLGISRATAMRIYRRVKICP